MKNTADPAGGQADTILEAALSYAARGWPVVPLWKPKPSGCCCRKGSKCDRPGKHPRTHHGYQGATTDVARISTWKWSTANVGIVPGREAGLLVIDVDPRNGGRESIRELEKQLGRLPTGPVVKSGGGGWHLYFRHPDGAVRKSSGVAGIDLKADGGFVVAPPSIHQSGGAYRWEPSPAEFALPELPAAWLTWICEAPCYIDHKRPLRTSQDIERTPSGGVADGDRFSVDEYVERCMASTIPKNPGERHANVFRLARLLRGHPEMATWPLARLRPILDRWYSLAVASVGQSGIRASPDDNWFDFAEGWERVKYPGEEGLTAILLERARQDELPEVALLYQSAEVRLLVALCRQLQREVGNAPFYLATSIVAKVLNLTGKNPRMRAWRWLQGLVRDGVLEQIDSGDPDKRIAAHYRYLPVD